MIETFWNADIVALATGLYIDNKCCLDILSKEKGQSFYKANGANVPNGELLAGIEGFFYGCFFFFFFAGFRGSS